MIKQIGYWEALLLALAEPTIAHKVRMLVQKDCPDSEKAKYLRMNRLEYIIAICLNKANSPQFFEEILEWSNTSQYKQIIHILLSMNSACTLGKRLRWRVTQCYFSRQGSSITAVITGKLSENEQNLVRGYMRTVLEEYARRSVIMRGSGEVYIDTCLSFLGQKTVFGLDTVCIQSIPFA